MNRTSPTQTEDLLQPSPSFPKFRNESFDVKSFGVNDCEIFFLQKFIFWRETIWQRKMIPPVNPYSGH
jgi:hypothetical protein